MEGLREINDWMVAQITLDSPNAYSSRWFTVPDTLRVYLRAIPLRYTAARKAGSHVLVVSNISVCDDIQRRGVFSGFLAELENAARKAGYEAVRIENLHEERILPFLTRRGYRAEEGMPLCYIRHIQSGAVSSVG